ncbi:MAG: hypothetical protein LBH32_11185 [Dysgonamonadaceae bacterium]|jgi:hypothetical protein|nr:hypothetical protein [Dysgonamonadaceae bacterium]
MFKKIALIGTFVFLLHQSCADEVFSPIPNAPVNLILYLHSEDSILNSPLAYKIFIDKRFADDQLGYGGILVVSNGIDSNGEISLFAYDLACPVEVNKTIKIAPDDTGKATCAKCKSVYYIADGNGAPISGSKYPLKVYKVSPRGNRRYNVSN